MAYVRRLIHRAAVYRPALNDTDTGVELANLQPVDGLSAVPCLLQAIDPKRAAMLFGPDLNCTAVVMFMAGVDVRPSLLNSGGQNDKLVITDEKDRNTSWMVIGVRDAAEARKMVMAGVKRITG